MTTVNTGTITVDFKFRPRPKAGVMVAGRIKMGPHDALVRPQDLELRTIKSMVLAGQLCLIGTLRIDAGGTVAQQAIGSYPGYKQYMVGAYIGSVGVLDTSITAGVPLGNYARVRAVMIGTSLICGKSGTRVPGSFTTGFLAFGE